jgi:membrane protein
MAEGILSRLEAAARRSRVRVGGVNPSLLLWNVVQQFLAVRVMGLAAEMTYYALLSIFPLVGAVGAGLGFMERFLGPGAVAEAEGAILAGLHAVFATEVTQEVFAPMVEGLLRNERGGFALGSFAVALFLASRIFRSAIHTLDVAYCVQEWRGTVALWSLGLMFSLGAVMTGVLVLAMVVVGPLLGGGHAIAHWLNLGAAFEVFWSTMRWPTVFVVATAFLAALYRFGPNVRNRWRQTLPGALFGVVGVVLVSIGFRLYLGVFGIDAPEVGDAEEAVTLAAQVVGAGLASLLWLWLVSMVILTGGVVNAEISRLRHEVLRPQEPAPGTAAAAAGAGRPAC